MEFLLNHLECGPLKIQFKENQTKPVEILVETRPWFFKVVDVFFSDANFTGRDVTTYEEYLNIWWKWGLTNNQLHKKTTKSLDDYTSEREYLIRKRKSNNKSIEQV